MQILEFITKDNQIIGLINRETEVNLKLVDISQELLKANINNSYFYPYNNTEEIDITESDLQEPINNVSLLLNKRTKDLLYVMELRGATPKRLLFTNPSYKSPDDFQEDLFNWTYFMMPSSPVEKLHQVKLVSEMETQRDCKVLSIAFYPQLSEKDIEKLSYLALMKRF